MKTNQPINRRSCLKYLGIAGAMISTPAMAQDIFKLIDPKGKSKKAQQAKEILEGAASMAVSATELDYPSEFSIGESLALEGFRRYGLPVGKSEVQKYVNLIGNAVARSSERSDIPYYVTVVDSPLYNAFACPGGIIFITSTLVKAMTNEAQLAGVLAHEVAHVVHKHSLQTVKRAKFFEGVSKISSATLKGEKAKSFQEMIGNLQTVLFDQGLDQNMEFEADLSGMKIAYRTGYDPAGFVQVLEMLQSKESTAQKSGSWFSTHPPLSVRIAKCRGQMTAYPDAAHLAKLENRFARYKSLF